MIPKLMIMQKAVITVQDKIPLLILLSVGAAFTFVWLILMRKRLNLRWYAAIPLAIAHTLYGVFTVTAFAFLENGFNKETFGNMSLFGGVFFMPLAYWLGAKISKRPMREVFDIFTPCMIFTVMCARVNCVISGCCLGLPIPGLDGTRFPTREAELIFYVVLLAIICPRIVKGRTGGKAYPVYMMSYGIFRFIIEFFRQAQTDTLFHLSHMWATLSLIIGISIYVELNIKGKKYKNERKKIKK